jgi:hypothetical protein
VSIHSRNRHQTSQASERRVRSCIDSAIQLESRERGLLLDAFSRPARKNTTDQNLLRQNFIAYIFRSKSVRSKRERKRNPSLLRRIILRLGRVTPWLAAAHRPSWRHGEGRAHGVENHPRHMRRLFVYHLEHSCQRHLVTANVGAAPNNSHLGLADVEVKGQTLAFILGFKKNMSIHGAAGANCMCEGWVLMQAPV